MTIRPFSLLLLSSVLLASSGCALFDRGPRNGASAEIMAEVSDLKLEKKLLQQQLEVSRKEQEALRRQIDTRLSGSPSDVALVQRELAESNRALSELRASYEKLEADRKRLLTSAQSNTGPASSAEAEALRRQLSETESKLTSTATSFAALQDENARLKQEVSTVRTQNQALEKQARELQSSLSQLNTELLAQKQARDRAQQEGAALRGQLQAVMSAKEKPPEAGATLSNARATAASDFSNTLSADPAKIKAGGSSTATRATPAPTVAPSAAASAVPVPAAKAAVRTHLVVAGDTLPRIAQKYYDTPDRWRDIYAANNTILRGDRPLKPGMQLVIP